MALHSIVIPIFNEEGGIERLYERMVAVLARLEALPDTRVEVILVNDGSKDRSAAEMDEVQRRDPRFKCIHFSRNFGHQVAITAGTEWASGDTVTVIDADLQDPPEVILEFVHQWQAGFEVVYGVRRTRQGETWFKLWTAKVFYRIIRSITQLDIPVDTGDFRLMDRKVVNAFLALPERHRYVRGLISWVGYKQVGVDYDRAQREVGTTHYPFTKMLKLAFDGVTSFSFLPLRFATWLGFGSAMLSFVGAVYVFYLKFFTARAMHGWSSLILVSLFLGGCQLMALGILGEYIGRMFDEVRRRPLYLISKTEGFAEQAIPRRFQIQLRPGSDQRVA